MVGIHYDASVDSIKRIFYEGWELERERGIIQKAEIAPSSPDLSDIGNPIKLELTVGFADPFETSRLPYTKSATLTYTNKSDVEDLMKDFRAKSIDDLVGTEINLHKLKEKPIGISAIIPEYKRQ